MRLNYCDYRSVEFIAITNLAKISDFTATCYIVSSFK